MGKRKQPFRDPVIIKQAVERITQRGECPAAAMKLALRMQRDEEPLEVWIDAVAIYASWSRGTMTASETVSATH